MIDYNNELPIYTRINHRFVQSNRGDWIKRDDLLNILHQMNRKYEIIYDFKNLIAYLENRPEDIIAYY